MKTVNIAELKSQLSAHLRIVQEGGEVVVCDRKKPIARIVPIDPAHHSEQEQRLIARGVLAPARRGGSGVLSKPAGKVTDTAMEQVWREERGRR